MELASMIAGEPFTDHPCSVSQPLASFLRTYNDVLDDTRRQDLYEYAAKCVGTAAPPSVERLRAERLIAWGDELWRRRPWTVFHRLKRRVARLAPAKDPEPAARYAIQAIHKLSNDVHERVLALVDELVAIGAGPGSRSGVVERPHLSDDTVQVSAHEAGSVG
jgi:hypothetical protein